jgi:hypothetical protein
MDRDVFAIKSRRTEKFDAALAACGATPVSLGTFFADDNDIRLFTVTPATP